MFIEKTTHKNHTKDINCAICGERICHQEWYYQIRTKYDDKPRNYNVHQLCYKFGADYIVDQLPIRSHDFKSLTNAHKKILGAYIFLKTKEYEARVIRHHRPNPRCHNAYIGL